jgi:hypothetical protein
MTTQNRYQVIAFISLVAFAFILQGCTKMQESFMTAQACLVDQMGVLQFKSIMRSIAKLEDLNYIDNSAQHGSDLKQIGADKLLKRDAALAIDVHIEGEGGIGVTAGNLGLPPYQIALGFTEGSDAARAHRLSDRLVQALSQQWHVEILPQGRGVLPMKMCGG